MSLNDISSPVKEHLGEFNKHFKELMKTNVALLDLIIKYLSQKKGKQIRPTLVLLAAGTCGGINKRSYTGGAMVELLHTATLIHDDVVDQSDERRGMASINAEWNNKIAVLVGDFLLSKGLLASIDQNEFEFLRIISKAVRRISEGELLSIEKARSLEVDEDVYFRITADKTASLMASCCEIGAHSANANDEERKAMADYGEFLGIAFQIKDDIMDYTSKKFAIGKPVGNDLKEKKITLPLLYAFTKSERSKVKQIIKTIKKKKATKDEVREIIDYVISVGGIDYAEKKAQEYIDKAKSAISIFEDSIYKQSMIDLADFVVVRKS